MIDAPLVRDVTDLFQRETRRAIQELAAATDDTGVTVAKAGTEIGTRGRINLIQGANVTLTITDDPAHDEVDVTIAAAGAGGLTDGDKGDVVVSGGGAVWTIDNNVVTPAKLDDGAGQSVLGRAAAGSGDRADIASSADGDVLRRAAGVLGWGAIPESSVAGLTTDLAAKQASDPTLDMLSGVKHVITANKIITAGYGTYMPRYLEVAAGVTFELGADADLEIG